MTRVIARPRALLDGASYASRIVAPGSDAERDFDQGRVFEKISNFMGFIVMLQTPEMPRLAGLTRLIRVANQRMVAIQGEDVSSEEPEVQYAFTLGPDSGKFIQISRVEEDEGTTLSWADVRDPARPVFRSPDLAGTIDDPAKVAELTQILVAGQDAAEWALD